MSAEGKNLTERIDWAIARLQNLGNMIKEGTKYDLVAVFEEAKKSNHSPTVITLADGVGTTRIIGPFPDEDSASEWNKKFWELFRARFGEDRITPVDTIHTFERGAELPSPEEFLRTIPDQASEAEFYL